MRRVYEGQGKVVETGKHVQGGVEEDHGVFKPQYPARVVGMAGKAGELHRGHWSCEWRTAWRRTIDDKMAEDSRSSADS